MKRCSACHLKKDEKCFGKNKNFKDGLFSICKDCIKIKDKKYYLDNKKKISAGHKKYRNNHKKEISAQKKEYAKINKDMLSIKKKEYYVDNKEKISQYQQDHKEEIKKRNKIYRSNNKEIIREKKRLYDAARKKERNAKLKIRRENDAFFKLRQLISHTIFVSLKRNGSSKNGSSILNFLSYTVQELKEHIENQFEPWMNWSNHKKYNPKTWKDDNSSTWTWNIDHIIPQADLPYTSMADEEFRKCWALSNLRPYSAKQNVIDGITKIRHKK